MTDYVGKIVIIEHAAMYDAHAIGLVTAQSKSFVTISGWRPHRREFAEGEDAKKRKISAIVKVLGDQTADLLTVQRAFERIQSAQSHMVEVQRNARTNYHAKIKDITL